MTTLSELQKKYGNLTQKPLDKVKKEDLDIKQKEAVGQKIEIVSQKKKNVRQTKRIVSQKELFIYPRLVSDGFTYKNIQKLKYTIPDDICKELKLKPHVKYKIKIENPKNSKRKQYERTLIRVGNKSLAFTVSMKVINFLNLKYLDYIRIIQIEEVVQDT